jgi:hypothetical protein
MISLRPSIGHGSASVNPTRRELVLWLSVLEGPETRFQMRSFRKEGRIIASPTTAVNTASNITRDFMSELKSTTRSGKHDRERACGRETAIAAVFMASAQGFKEVDFCEMSEFVAAISHDHLLLLDQTPSQFRW